MYLFLADIGCSAILMNIISIRNPLNPEPLATRASIQGKFVEVQWGEMFSEKKRFLLQVFMEINNRFYRN